MAALVCDICGGKLQGKPGGIFECDSCGMEYSTEWAKAKIQEIKGTVKVEGTVAVQGTVEVKGAANADSLLRRGQIAMEDRNWDEAKRCFRQVLDIVPECGAAYWGLAWAAVEGDIGQLIIHCQKGEPTNIQRARQFADAETRKKLAALDNAILQDKQRWAENAARKKAEQDKALQQKAESVKTAMDRLPTIRKRLAPLQERLAAGDYYTVGLTSNGTLITAHCNESHRRELASISNAIAVASGSSNTVVLLNNGTVREVGEPSQSRKKDVDKWRNITAIASGGPHILGLRTDGTVVAAGNNNLLACNVSGWRQITAIAAGYSHSVGLHANGTVVATGDNRAGQCNVNDWTNIVAIAAGFSHTVGLRADGTVVAVGSNYTSACDTELWSDIIAIATGTSRTLGIRANGTVVSTGDDDFGKWDVSNWSKIVAISVGHNHAVGLRVDGTVVTTGEPGKADMSGWKLFESVEAMKNAKAKKSASLKAEKAAIEAELPNIKGVFAAGKRSKLEARLAEIENELRKLS